ncbi:MULTISPECIES: hypothetical protein [unclassified Pseudoxanthomonas]|uniref:hypothetical protein n=1 Tax=unclassified Pseudoxanthomonas TaxID=2645906 RepID=UPI0030785E1A
MNRVFVGAALAALPMFCQAQSPPAAPAMPAADAAEPSDTLRDALTCRTTAADIAGLLPRLRQERPSEFVQTERQYSEPVMDLYRLNEPVHAWGHDSDAVVIAANRVLIAVEGPLEQAAMHLEQALEQSRDTPLSSAFDEQHALVVYAAEQPGLEDHVLIGCEYRIPDLSLLDDPLDSWRKATLPLPPSPVPQPPGE